MTPTKKEDRFSQLSRDAIQAFDDVSGLHPGFRPTHAKGILLSGEFTPAAAGANITRAPHLHRAATPVSVRLSDFGGMPAIPDNHPDASPRGFALRFHLAEHTHTDIIAHSVNGFPTRTAEEFVELLRAIYASASGATKPSPVELFLGSHPAALRFVQAPKPLPVSFATESFFAVSAYRFTDTDGVSRFGRYRIEPVAGGDYLSQEAAAGVPANFLFDEIKDRISKQPVEFSIRLQLAAAGDVVDDATVQWPEDRPQIDFGTVRLHAIVPDNDAQQRHIIFDPIPRVEGIDPSGDPLLEPRAAVYLMSGRRRRANGGGSGEAVANH